MDNKLKLRYKELQDHLGKAKSYDELIKMVHELSPEMNKDTLTRLILADLIENRYGKADLSDNFKLNEYKSRILSDSYGGLNEANKLIDPKFTELRARLDPMSLSGAGESVMSQSGDLVDFPIRIGTKGNNTSLKISALGHEIGHEHDKVAEFLKRALESTSGKKNKELLNKIEDIGNKDLLDHIRGVDLNQGVGSFQVGDLTPQNVGFYEEIISNEKPSKERMDALKKISSYKEQLKIDTLDKTPNYKQNIISSKFNIPVSKVKKIPGEILQQNISGDILDDALGRIKTPIDAEITKQSGHHLSRPDLDMFGIKDTGSYTWRNIGRLLKNKGLLSPLLKIGAGAAAGGIGLAAQAAEEGFDAEPTGGAEHSLTKKLESGIRLTPEEMSKIGTEQDIDQESKDREAKRQALMQYVRKYK